MAPLDDKDESEAKAEDSPVIKELKVLDDRYLVLEREFEKEAQELQRKFTTRQAPLLEKRACMLTNVAEGQTEVKGGTPALEGFWLKALQNHPEFRDIIQEWDEPLLEYIIDVVKTDLDDTDADVNQKGKGFKLLFKFAENPYFTNTELSKEYLTEEVSPYTGEMQEKEIKVSKIEWKAGQDITVEKVAKKVKGGGAKKNKQKKEKEEARESFFRCFFRNLRPDMDVTDDMRQEISMMDDAGSDDEDDEDIVEQLMCVDHDAGCALRDSVIPFAVRWYTGEASPEDDDDEDEEEEEEENDDEEDSDDDEPAPRAKAKAKNSGRDGRREKGGASRDAPKASGGEAGKDEECKQQ